jgi:hypothetical protein
METMPASPVTPSLPVPRLEFAFSLSAEVGAAVELGLPPGGRRHWIPVVGGSFAGPRICGRILPGADWQTVRSEDVIEIDARYALQTDDGAVVSIVNTGLRRIGSPDHRSTPASDEVYFRTVACFETSGAKYEWLNRSIFLGTGFRRHDIVTIEFWQVL